MANDDIRGDRRIRRRYPIAMEMEYKVMVGAEVVATGAGRTGNISSGGVLFLTEGNLADGPALEISIRWPTVSGDEPFVELRMSGQIVRSDANGTALRLCRYHFQKLSNTDAAVNHLLRDAMIQ